MDKKTKIWIIIFAALIVLGLGGWFALSALGEGTVAVISIDGVEQQRIDLSRVNEAYDIEIETEWGYNIVHVQPGRISVTEANCPDGVCVRQGAIEQSGIPIVCLPHRLIVRIEGSEIDA